MLQKQYCRLNIYRIKEEQLYANKKDFLKYASKLAFRS